MAKYKLEYIWLDGYTPVANLRSKTLIKDFDSFPKLEQLPIWGFDGSSTQQAEGKSSDIVLKPVAVYPDSTRKNGVLVMCETYLHTGAADEYRPLAEIVEERTRAVGVAERTGLALKVDRAVSRVMAVVLPVRFQV